jgi:DNA-binding NtrC family response regulator
MPGLGGEELLKQVQQKSPSTPVIVISGVAGKESAKKLIEMGAFAYFTKPYELDELETTVARAIAHRQSLVQSSRQQDQPPPQ